ncbi:hypothetical protein APA_1342 [Pseudanabaena sp. lw0831]|uniref:hypothetical protein n=1 Tax=Pseudanabaena sp. lw0831 TaxID=1357935 RepID=UPI001915FDBC|nr:hypothetical protein [Pseudanabaena sp. lw0831]GBO53435.1 hypothetical protein APA_1342 [Pseudanabaena sp. lw0831]
MIHLRNYNSDDWDAIAAIHDRARLDEQRLLQHAINRCGKTLSTHVLSGNDVALNLHLSEGFKIIKTKTRKLNGNESF